MALARDWNADAYHRLSGPQVTWAKAILDRLELAGGETVLDAGCGSGRVTRLLLQRLPRGRVIAVDGAGDTVGPVTSTTPLRDMTAQELLLIRVLDGGGALDLDVVVARFAAPVASLFA